MNDVIWQAFTEAFKSWNMSGPALHPPQTRATQYFGESLPIPELFTLEDAENIRLNLGKSFDDAKSLLTTQLGEGKYLGKKLWSFDEQEPMLIENIQWEGEKYNLLPTVKVSGLESLCSVSIQLLPKQEVVS
ncbi:hypothetical protein Dxin01_01075 [Deinococcus xinjiangensis]|uniref:Uncharacterized protein n=1 Tax=Deinococcus xinjiangensis TaxID=457454 RepID=A0ABP9V7T9_9DEIO